MTISERVKAIVSEELGITDVSSGAVLVTDLGADSADRISLTMALEEAFDLEIPDADAEELLTVSDIVSYLERRSAAVAWMAIRLTRWRAEWSDGVWRVLHAHSYRDALALAVKLEAPAGVSVVRVVKVQRYNDAVGQ
jgi:acyl carrier protein